jgi:branched-chain amino acid transport system substrate-binding protein
VQSVSVRKVERVDGRLQSTVIHTFTGISRFWTYRPDELLRNRVYSRDFPLCRSCS